ncbi:hypothetical protein G039_0324580 [Pseudomonas aeruginosa VRFPA01]|nr:hypothetical protein G039_0324580 [Pseudomonas aeruginosa VRFPA01]
MQAAALEATFQRLVADQVSDRPAEAHHEQRGEQCRAGVGQGAQADRGVFAEPGDQPRIVSHLAQRGEAADQPQRTERLAPQDIQGALAMRAAEQREGDHAQRGEQRATDQHIGHDHRQGLAQRVR